LDLSDDEWQNERLDDCDRSLQLLLRSFFSSARSRGRVVEFSNFGQRATRAFFLSCLSSKDQ